MAGFKWTTPPLAVWPQGAEAYIVAVRRGVHGVAMKWAAILSNEMKQNAPWTDRSGAARQTLYTEVQPPTPAQVTDMIELMLWHGVDHGVFLELKNAGRFAIINPTLDQAAPRVWADVVRLFT
jgi:hypothetical protein